LLAALKQKIRGPADMAMFLPCNALQQGAEPDVPRSIQRTDKHHGAESLQMRCIRVSAPSEAMAARWAGVVVWPWHAMMLKVMDMRRAALAARVLRRMNTTMW
jgi:hypothetical protein